VLLIHLLWSVGIHGTVTIKNAFVNPFLIVALTENVVGGNNIIAGDFFAVYVILGGAGSTLSLALMMIFLAKSEQFKVLGKASILPGLFNINEPIIFGAPIVYNPYLVLPFIIAPIVNVSIAYLALNVGLVGKIMAAVPWTSPVGLGAFLATGGDFRAVILAFICLTVSGLIYFPFFKIYDNKLYKEQTKEA
jgi:cellobiose PTS system EIIC component